MRYWYWTVKTISKLSMERSVKFGIKISKISRCRSRFPDNAVAEFGHLQRTAKKCTKNQNARALLLLIKPVLFIDVAVVVAVVVYLNSLIASRQRQLIDDWRTVYAEPLAIIFIVKDHNFIRTARGVVDISLFICCFFNVACSKEQVYY